MKKILVFQSPAFMYEVVPIFYRELNKLNYFDEFYFATDKKKPYGLGDNVRVLELEKDEGWESNLQQLLEIVPEDLFVMMCDDHITVPQTKMNLDAYFDVMDTEKGIGRLQLSPPTRNYALFLRARSRSLEIPDDSKPFYLYDHRYRWHLNFQPSIWRKEYLQEVISGGGNKSQLELRASEKARSIPGYRNAYIGRYAVRFENFFASCQVHHLDPDFHKRKTKPHYRMDFVHYAMNHDIPLDPTKRVQLKGKGIPFTASVPSGYFVQHYGDWEKLEVYAMKNDLRDRLFKLQRLVRAKIAPYVSVSRLR